VEQRREVTERTDWVWSEDLREALHDAITQTLDERALVTAQAASFGRPAPDRRSSERSPRRS
jgi:hypothetical protein